MRLFLQTRNAEVTLHTMHTYKFSLLDYMYTDGVDVGLSGVVEHVWAAKATQLVCVETS
jgi:hypothetical protein